MKLFEVDTMQQALDKTEAALQKIQKIKTSESIPVSECAGRIAAEDVPACMQVPAFDRSAVDGYAVRAADTAGAGEFAPCFLDVIGQVSMGEHVTLQIRAGQCVYVPTGGMLPAGADAMVMVEYTDAFDAGHIVVYQSVGVGKGVVHAGEDMQEGEVLIGAGTRLNAGHIGALCAAGFDQISVYRKPVIGILSSGDELLDPGQPYRMGSVYDSNTCALSSMAQKWGMDVKETAVIRDDAEALREALGRFMQTCDIVAVSGGSSQGKKDFSAVCLDEVSGGGVFTHGLALKPGKPTILGYDGTTETILAGLPGHPAAAMLVFRLVLCGALDRVMGCAEETVVFAEMTQNYGCDPGKANCVMVSLIRDEAGYRAVPVRGKSGLLTLLTKSDGYVLTDHNCEGIRAGGTVPVHLL